MLKVTGKYFYGHEVSEYGQEHGRVDYATLAKAINIVMANDLIERTNGIIGYWEEVSGSAEYTDASGKYYSYEEAQERIEELESLIEELDEEENAEEIAEYRDDINELEDPIYKEVFQWFIVDEQGAEILKEAEEIVYYNDELNMYLWGVTHWGTSWDYVLTNIPCNCGYSD